MNIYEIDFDNMTDEEIDEFYRPKKTNSRKSLAPLFIYLILKDESSSDKHLSHNDIAKKLKEYPYEIELERKAVGRIIHNLADSDLGIYNMKGFGVWYDESA